MQILARQALVAVTVLVAACASSGSAPDPTMKAARVAPPEAVVACAEWVRRAEADPELSVERVPTPVAFDPPPIPRRLPRGVVGKDGRAEVRIRVLVDTLGVADMRTFTVVKTTHPSLARSVRAAVAKWKFVPAEVSGCKVPRNFNYGGATAAEPKRGDGAPGATRR